MPWRLPLSCVPFSPCSALVGTPWWSGGLPRRSNYVLSTSIKMAIKMDPGRRKAIDNDDNDGGDEEQPSYTKGNTEEKRRKSSKIQNRK